MLDVRIVRVILAVPGMDLKVLPVTQIIVADYPDMGVPAKERPHPATSLSGCLTGIDWQ